MGPSCHIVSDNVIFSSFFSKRKRINCCDFKIRKFQRKIKCFILPFQKIEIRKIKLISSSQVHGGCLHDLAHRVGSPERA